MNPHSVPRLDGDDDPDTGYFRREDFKTFDQTRTIFKSTAIYKTTTIYEATMPTMRDLGIETQVTPWSRPKPSVHGPQRNNRKGKLKRW